NDIVGANNGTLQNGTTFATGMVARAFSFDGVDDYVRQGQSPTFDVGAGDGFTIECWINPSDVSLPRPLVEWNNTNGIIGANLWISVNALGGGPGSLWADLVDSTNGSHQISSPAGLLTVLSFHHVAVTYDKKTGMAVLYDNGAAVATTNLGSFTPLTSYELFLGRRISGLGAGAVYRGLMDEVSLYNRALTATEIRAIYLAAGAGKCSSPLCLPIAQISLGNATNVVSGPPDWLVNSLSFVASQNGTPFQLSGNPLGILLDAFKLTQSSNALYYLPEETLSPLLGESAYGNWRLELWDNRTGANLPGSQLVSWRLELLLGNTNVPAITLTNGVPYTNTVVGPEIRYFIVDVPLAATYATNTLIGNGDLILLGDRFGLPVGDPARDDYYVDDQGVGGGEYLLLGTNLPPAAPLQPGQRYYLGVKNVVPTETNLFALRVDFDRLDATNLNVTPLTNGIPYSTNIAATNLLDYYQYDASPLAVSLTFEVFNAGGDVDLVARHGLPLPNPNNYDYISQNLGTNDELISVFPIPGRWYLGVVNNENFTVAYTIKATETLATIVSLTNAVPYTNTIGTNSFGDFYRFTVPSNAVRATFEILNPSGDVNLYVKNGLPLPGPGRFDFFSGNPGTNEEQLIVSNTSTPVALTPGDWYLAVQNSDAAPVTYSVRATQFIPPIITLTNRSAFTNSIAGTDELDYYEFDVTAKAFATLFEILNPTRPVVLALRKGLPLPTTNSFDYLTVA
ncbi:MAG: hypothetical protein DME26_14870, partial [Verrucomicrobia bacterium]